MSTLAESLKKQNEFLQGEIERFANAVDSLAAQLVDAQNQFKALRDVQSEMMPADSDIVTEGEAVGAQKSGAQNVNMTAESVLAPSAKSSL
ncbi:hypothetical protein ACQZ6C_04145 [Rhizobium rhizogenes]|uniref:hypothetical protein n=1 Tax=Rhizobium rhizogenes TaxID=359 RepID=UPI001573DAD1|nr:hypothetical protein [Rhizobium rhizogenes]NTF87800.1 hypothetical protein [Rhizobium rhizogenes]